MARKPHKYHYIYKTTCAVTGRYYIGMHSTSNLEDGYLGSGKHLRRSIRKYGSENHTKEILEFLETREVLKNREFQLVNEDALKDPKCMNLQLGDRGGFSSEDHKQKCIKSMSKAGLKRIRELMTDREWKEKISKKHKDLFLNGEYRLTILKNLDFTGKTHTSETKAKIGKSNSISQAGVKNSQFGTCWITNNIENKKIKKSELIPQNWKIGRIIKKK